MTESCMLTFGDRGTGKTSTGTEPDFLRVALQGAYPTLYLDGKGTSARRLAGHLEANGLGARCRLEFGSRPDRVLTWPFRRPAAAVNPLDRAIEEALADEEFGQLFWSLRGLKGGTVKPYTLKFLTLATRLWSRQPEMRHLTWARKALRPGTPECLAMVRATTDRDAVEQLGAAADRAARNPVQWETEVGASERLLEPVDSPAVWARHGPDDYWERALDGRYQTYLDLSGLAPAAQRTLGIAAYTGAVNAVRRRFARTGKATPLLVAIEDAGALDLVTPFLLTSLQYDREAGVVYWLVSQTLDDFEPAVLGQLMALCEVHRYYRMNAGIDASAEDLANPTFDPLAVHSYRERQVHAGWDEVATEQRSAGVSVDHLHHERKDERTSRGLSVRARYKTVVEAVYKTPQLHLQEFKTQLSNLQVFQRFVRDSRDVRRETLTPLGEPWPLGLSESRTRTAIERIRRLPDFRPPWLPPELPPLPPAPPPPPKAKRAAKKKAGELPPETPPDASTKSAAERLRDGEI